VKNAYVIPFADVFLVVFYNNYLCASLLTYVVYIFNDDQLRLPNSLRNIEVIIFK